MATNEPINYTGNKSNFRNLRTAQAENTDRASYMPVAPNAYARNMQPQPTQRMEPSNQQAGRSIPPVTSTLPMMPTTLDSTYYTAGLLRKYIGSLVRVEFLIGSTAPLIDRTGVLQDVGASYIILRPSDAPENDLICDLFSIKFVNVIR